MKLVAEQVSVLVRDELKLAQLEMTGKAKQAGKGAGMMGGGGLVALYGVACLIACVIIAISHSLQAWLSALIVGAALLAVAARPGGARPRPHAQGHAADAHRGRRQRQVRRGGNQGKGAPVTASEVARRCQQLRDGNRADQGAPRRDSGAARRQGGRQGQGPGQGRGAGRAGDRAGQGPGGPGASSGAAGKQAAGESQAGARTGGALAATTAGARQRAIAVGQAAPAPVRQVAAKGAGAARKYRVPLAAAVGAGVLAAVAFIVWQRSKR